MSLSLCPRAHVREGGFSALPSIDLSISLTARPPVSAAAPATALHALRLKRGRLTLVPADIDPDAEEALLGGGGGGGGGSVCAPGPAGGRAAAALAF